MGLRSSKSGENLKKSDHGSKQLPTDVDLNPRDLPDGDVGSYHPRRLEGQEDISPEELESPSAISPLDNANHLESPRLRMLNPKGRAFVDIPVESLALLGKGGFHVVANPFPGDARAIRHSYSQERDCLVVVLESESIPVTWSGMHLTKLMTPQIELDDAPDNIDVMEAEPQFPATCFATECGGRFLPEYSLGCPACGATNTYLTKGKPENREEQCVACKAKMELVFSFELVCVAGRVEE